MIWERRVATQVGLDQPAAARISDIEERLSIRFPQAYKATIAEAEGCRPLSPCFAISRSKSQMLLAANSEDVDIMLDVEEIDTFLFASESLADQLNDIYSIDSWLKRVTPILGDVFPFAIDLADNPLCFDYRNGVVEPAIVYLDMERDATDALWFVAASFSSLLEGLLKVE